MLERAPDRHDLVWLAPAGARMAQPADACCAALPEAPRLLADWLAAGRPLIVTRQPAVADPAHLRLGLALPPLLGKRRLAFDVPCTAIERHAVPPALDEATRLAALPPAWRDRARALASLPAIASAAPRLFGSAAIQLVTGLPCLGADSDLDLLLAPRDWPAAQAACRALGVLDASAQAPRVDGEIRNADGEAVAWRELASDSRQVLAKSLREVRLLPRTRFAARFPPTPGARA